VFEEVYQVSFATNKDLIDKLDHVKDLLSHKFPNGTYEDIIHEALDLIISKKDKALKASTSSSQKSTASNSAVHSRYIPVSVQDQVWKRDGRRCTYVSSKGKRCECTRFLQLDHIEEFAKGGSSRDVTNIPVLCQAHNLGRALGAC
jgi:hypothetical protein